MHGLRSARDDGKDVCPLGMTGKGRFEMTWGADPLGV